MSAELSPCPWCPNPCGSGPRVKSRSANSTASGKHFFVRCPMCLTEGPRSTLSEAEAITRWNRRTTIQPTAREVGVFAGYMDGVEPRVEWSDTIKVSEGREDDECDLALARAIEQRHGIGSGT
jgi:hypothetical protein